MGKLRPRGAPPSKQVATEPAVSRGFSCATGVRGFPDPIPCCEPFCQASLGQSRGGGLLGCADPGQGLGEQRGALGAAGGLSPATSCASSGRLGAFNHKATDLLPPAPSTHARALHTGSSATKQPLFPTPSPAPPQALSRPALDL